MSIQFSSAPVESIESDVLVIFAPEKKNQPLPANLAGLNQTTGGWLDEIYASGEFSGKANETALLYRPQGIRAKRLLAVGMQNSDFSRAAGTAIRAVSKLSSIAYYVP